MNTIEEELWDYIDGNCTIAENELVEAKLASDSAFNAVYLELLAVNSELNQLDLEQPSMSFTRNVMEQVNLELKPVALKTKVDTRVIYGIGAFFAFSLLAIVGYVLATADYNFKFDLPKLDFAFYDNKIINSTVVKVFLMVDCVLALLYLDSLLRRKNTAAQKKGV